VDRNVQTLNYVLYTSPSRYEIRQWPYGMSWNSKGKSLESATCKELAGGLPNVQPASHASQGASHANQGTSHPSQ